MFYGASRTSSHAKSRPIFAEWHGRRGHPSSGGAESRGRFVYESRPTRAFVGARIGSKAVVDAWPGPSNSIGSECVAQHSAEEAS